MVKLGGVGWFEDSSWFDPRDTQTAERLSVLLERLDLRKVHCVGLLDRPISLDSNQKKPSACCGHLQLACRLGSPTRAGTDAHVHETLMVSTRSLDNDRSFVGNPNLIPLVTDIRNRMQTYSQELQLALSWDYQDQYRPIATCHGERVRCRAIHN